MIQLASSLSIRPITSTDAGAVAQLSGELGYPVSVSVMEERIRRFGNLPAHMVFVACVSDTVVGWIDVGIVYHLQAEPYGEIGGLVVSQSCRSSGIGRELVKDAQRWATEQGVKKMVVRSRITREAAHRFYLREGYSMTKTSAVFSKDLQ